MMNDLRKALFRALEKSDINMLKALLDQGVSLKYEEGDPDQICFIGAPYEGMFLEALKFLHSAGADLTAREPEFQDSLLHWCVNNQEADLLPWLIAQGLDVNAQNSKGRTPLVFAMYGVWRGDDAERHACAMRDVRLLVEAGADINIQDDEDSLLHKAVVAGASEFVSYLIAHGADVNAVNTDKETPLHSIALRSASDIHQGHLIIIKQLLDAGADINALDKDGYSPLACTHVGPNTLVARKLVDYGADVNANNGAPLRMLMNDDAGEILDMLIAQGAVLDRVHGDEHLSPIGLAANNNCLHGITALLDHGIDIEVENIDGETPLLIAAWHGHYDAVALLLSHGANRHAKDHYNNTALSWAERRKEARLIELLTTR